MKLAEALAERADAMRRVEQLRNRIVGNARYQEGEDPVEDAGRLLVDAHDELDRLESLIARINRTNAAVTLPAEDGEQVSVTTALARRDVLRLRHSLVTAAADAAAGQRGHRQLRSELAMLAALPVRELREQADDLARRLRVLDTGIQRANWEADLLD